MQAKPLSREIVVLPGADGRSLFGRRDGQARYREHLPDPAWSKTLACMEAPCAGTGRSLDRP